MAKDKTANSGNVPNKALSARISYLYQAAAYLQNVPTTLQQPQQLSSLSAPTNNESSRLVEEGFHSRADGAQGASLQAQQDTPRSGSAVKNNDNCTTPLARQLLSHLREVSLKSQVRLTPNIKRSICRRCNTLLSPGHTSELVIENSSRNASKPWADVLIVRCWACQAEKRFPIGASRPPSRARRTVSNRLARETT